MAPDVDEISSLVELDIVKKLLSDNQWQNIQRHKIAQLFMGLEKNKNSVNVNPSVTTFTDID